MLKDGIPIIYQGQEQSYTGSGVPQNREAIWLSHYSNTSQLYKWIASLNKIRGWAIAQDANYLRYHAYPIYTDSHILAMRKGFDGYQVVGVFTNVGSSSSTFVSPATGQTGFTANQEVMDVMSCRTFTTDSSGTLTRITLSRGLPRVFYPAAGLAGTAICGATGGRDIPF